MTHKLLDPVRFKRDEDYEVHWNYTSFKDKVILDLGADLGKTTSFFFEKGAKRVIAVECENDRYKTFDKLVENYGDDPDVACLHLFIDSGAQISELINIYNPDLVKVDIEGWETKIVDMKPEFFLMPKEWLIEAHNGGITKVLVDYITKFDLDMAVYHVLGVDIILTRRKK